MWEVTIEKSKEKYISFDTVHYIIATKLVKRCTRLYFLLFHTQFLFEDALRYTKLFLWASV